MIRFEHFSKRYGAVIAVEDVDLAIEPGEVLALLGPNGSGKTTCLKAAAGLVHPSGGAVLIGEPPLPASAPAAREAISFLPQRVVFPDSLTGFEAVEFYRRVRGLAPVRTAEALELSALNGASRRRVGTYSGGMVQRLGLAVASLPDVPVLLLDEPTAALDPDGLAAFDLLVERQRNRGRSVVFTSHQLGDAERLADRFAVLVGGRLVAVLHAAELRARLARHGVFRLIVDGHAAPAAAELSRWGFTVRVVGREIVVDAPPIERPRVLDALREIGVPLREVRAEEGRLDVFYRELVNAAPAVPEAT